MWWRKREPAEHPDMEEARALRAETLKDLAEVKQQSAYVSRLTTRLIERRALNHFGDDIQITFTPRGNRA